MGRYNEINESLIKLHNTITDEDKTIEEIIDEINNKEIEYNWNKSIKCHNCGHLFKPFYFGDKDYNRMVSQDCPKCDIDNTFRPIDVQDDPDEFIIGV